MVMIKSDKRIINKLKSLLEQEYDVIKIKGGFSDIGMVMFKNMKDDMKFYFLHEYYFDSTENSDVAATANYEGEYVCSIRKDNIFGVQFHPEKSHHFGMQLLQNFSEI